MKIVYTILAASILFASCGQYQKSKSGLVYKITRGNGKEKLKVGQFVIFNFEYKGGPKDSVLTSTFGHLPAVFPVDTSGRVRYSFVELFPLCSIGDKINFALSTDTLRKLGNTLPDDPAFAPKSFIKGRVEIINAFNNQQDVQQYMQKESDNERQREIKEIENYLAKKNIKAQKTENGVFVEIANAGNGAKIDSGKQASVFYTGTILSTGKEFDSNIKNGVKQQPFKFVVGQRQVIPGWEEGIKYFAQGGKGKLYIPAMLAYGQQAHPPVMPAYSNLIFDIEVDSVTTAPALVAHPAVKTPIILPQQHHPIAPAHK